MRLLDLLLPIFTSIHIVSAQETDLLSAIASLPQCAVCRLPLKITIYYDHKALILLIAIVSEDFVSKFIMSAQ